MNSYVVAVDVLFYSVWNKIGFLQLDIGFISRNQFRAL